MHFKKKSAKDLLRYRIGSVWTNLKLKIKSGLTLHSSPMAQNGAALCSDLTKIRSSLPQVHHGCYTFHYAASGDRGS